MIHSECVLRCTHSEMLQLIYLNNEEREVFKYKVDISTLQRTTIRDIFVILNSQLLPAARFSDFRVFFRETKLYIISHTI